MPRHLLRAATAVSLLALGACGDQSRSTAPTDALPMPVAPRIALTATAACLKDDALYLQQQVATLFSDPKLRRSARDYASTVESRCNSATPQAYPAANATQTLATAPAAALAYTEWLLTRRGESGFAADDTVLWTYLSRLFRYVGYTIPSSALGFSGGGFVQLCRSGATCTIESPDGRRGVRFPPATLSTQNGVPFLVTGVPVQCSAFQNSASYSVYGGCLELSVDPKAGPSFVLKAPGALVEMCTTVPATPSFVTARRRDVYTGQTTTQGKLGQRSEGVGGTLSPISFRPYADGFLDDFWCDHPKPVAPPSGALGAVRRVGDAILALFTPNVAYAGHGGLGTLPGSISQLSVFGPLDGYAFNGDFESDAIGAFPQTQAEMRSGSWSLLTGPSPSRASVQLGAGLFGSKYLQLNQGGGAAASKDSLTFIGALAQPITTAVGDADRSVRLRFRAAVLSPRAFDAKFVARATAGDFATLVFRDGKSSQAGTLEVVPPPGATLLQPTTRGTWSQNVVDSYQITVTFDRASGTAEVHVGLVGPMPLARYRVPLADLASFRWVLTGRDGQLIGSDDYQLFDAPAGLP